MKKTLLLFLIDDDLDDQEFFGMIMDEYFPQVEYGFANNGVEAIEKLNALPHYIPNIILLDMNMPKMNGLECLEQIRKIPRLLATHVYMYSTSAESTMVAKCLELGANGYLVKEVSTQKIQKVFEKIFSAIPEG